MCQQVKCAGCGKSTTKCSLVNGLCHSCRQNKKNQVSATPKVVSTSNAINSHVYYTN